MVKRERESISPYFTIIAFRRLQVTMAHDALACGFENTHPRTHAHTYSTFSMEVTNRRDSQNRILVTYINNNYTESSVGVSLRYLKKRRKKEKEEEGLLPYTSRRN